MLVKLYKYEFLKIFRSIWFIFIAIAISCLIAVISFMLPNSIYGIDMVRTILFIPYPITILFSIVFCFITVIHRFYTSMFSAEGYLTFTLPVSNMVHFYSKFIVGISTTIITIIFAILTLEPIGRVSGHPEIAPSGWNYSTIASYGFDGTNIPLKTSPVIIFLYVLAGLTIAFLLFFTALSIGQMFKNRILASVGAYFVLYFISQSIALMGIIIFAFTVDLFSGFSSVDMEQYLNNIFATLNIVMIIQFFGMICLCHYAISKKLNLE